MNFECETCREIIGDSNIIISKKFNIFEPDNFKIECPNCYQKRKDLERKAFEKSLEK